MTNTRDDLGAAPEAASQTVYDQFEQPRGWGTDRKSVSIGGAALLALVASIITTIIVRRRAEARAESRMAWIATRAGDLRATMPALPALSARQAAPFGGAGGALLLAALWLARARQAQSTSRMDQLHQRIAMLESQASQMQFDAPRARDVMMGIGLAFGLSKIASRLSSQSSK